MPFEPEESRERQVLVLINRSVDPHLVVYHEPQSAISEQYRSFRTNLQALNPDGAPRALALTSSIKGEGKTLTAANLATALAELPETRVLLVDADLRGGSLAPLFGRERAPGLSDLLLDGCPLEEVITATLVPNLSLLPAGREVPTPSELLGSSRIADLVSALKAEFHYILFDTPPVLPFTDSSVLGTRLDGTILVVRMEKTPKEQVERTLANLRAAGNNVVGCFLAGSRSLDRKARDYVIQDDE